MNLYKTLRVVVALIVACCAVQISAQSGTWVPLTNQPSFYAGSMFLLTDGRVLVNEVDSVGFGTKRWWTLTPNAAGSYRNGTWGRVADSNDDRLYFASGTFADGRLILSGGEYSSIGFEILNTEIYDPVFNTWTSIAPPPGWTEVGDAPSVILADGRFLVGQINGNQTAIYDPTTGLWSSGGLKLNGTSSEETWTLLPDDSILSWDCFGHPHSQKYIPSLNQWVTAGNTIPDLVLANSFETGCGMLLPNGTVFAMGGPPVSSIYTPPPISTQPGTWTAGPVPAQVGGRDVGQEDAPGAFLPNGNLLLSLGPVIAGGGSYEAPSYFFEYDGTNLVRVTDPPAAARANYFARLLVLPTGEVLFGNSEPQMFLYSNLPAPNPAYKPTVLGYPTIVERFLPYGMKGLLFNGVSNGSNYGDEVYNATNWPLVRLNDGFSRATYYCRTFGHSTMGVQTGGNTVATNFIVPKPVPAGKTQLKVVANGVPSDPVSIYVVNTSNVLSFGITQGTLASGGLSELKASDNLYLFMNSTFFGASQVVFKGFVPTVPTMNVLGSYFEGGVNTSGVMQTLEYWNWNTSAWETIDSRSASTFDLGIQVFATSPVSRFIDPSGEVVARVTYVNFSFTAFQSRIDRFVWLSGP